MLPFPCMRADSAKLNSRDLLRIRLWWAGWPRTNTSKELGQLDVVRANSATTFDFGEWSSAVASRKNDDGTISMITIDPTNSGFEFVVGEKAGKRTLTLRDAQHEYVFNETN